MGDYSKYQEVERLYDRICGNSPEVIQQMKDLIDQYAESRDKVYSNRAGRSILPKSEAFRSLCGDNAPSVFGILLNKHLIAAGWTMEEGSDGSKRVKIYSCP